MGNPRRAMRLRSFGYGAGHACFITFCTAHRRAILSSIREDHVVLSDLGALVQSCWEALPLHHDGVVIDLHVVMPDHVHAIVMIAEKSPAVLPYVVAMFKAGVTRRARVQGFWGTEPLWQRGFHERGARDPRQLRRFQEYILANPYRWHG